MGIGFKIFLYVFVLWWLWLVFTAVTNPKKVMRMFPTYFRIFGINPDNPNKWALIILRILWGVAFLFGLFVLFGMITGFFDGF